MLISASGGVMIESWHFASNVKESESVAQAKASIARWNDSNQWYQ
jgi:hypothetical protein